jgi:hypothetical protein
MAPLLADGSAAQAAGTSCSLASLGTCNITLENVQYSGFSFSGFTPVAGDVFNLAGFSASGTVSLSFSPDRLVDTLGTFSYTATLLNGLTFNKAQANLTGSTLGNGSYSTTLLSAQLPTSPTSTNGAGAFENFNPGFTSQVFTQNFHFDFFSQPDTLTSVGAAFTTKAPASVPSPLPILGTAAAFGFSRKLRSRIRLAA